MKDFDLVVCFSQTFHCLLSVFPWREIIANQRIHTSVFVYCKRLEIIFYGGFELWYQDLCMHYIQVLFLFQNLLIVLPVHLFTYLFIGLPYFFPLRLEYSMILMVTLKMESCSSKRERLSQF